jgi:hypothetical protein
VAIDEIYFMSLHNCADPSSRAQQGDEFGQEVSQNRDKRLAHCHAKDIEVSDNFESDIFT